MKTERIGKRTLTLTDRELATVKAALRYWKREGTMSDGHEREIATRGREIKPLGPAEIDAILERLDG